MLQACYMLIIINRRLQSQPCPQGWPQLRHGYNQIAIRAWEAWVGRWLVLADLNVAQASLSHFSKETPQHGVWVAHLGFSILAT